MTMQSAHLAHAVKPFTWHEGWRYGLMGLPLAFVALPLYVVLPNHYALAFGVPLATLGSLLLGARLFDALIDPLLGRWSDRLFARSIRAVLVWAAMAALMLGVGFALLFFPPVHTQPALLVWAGACLVLTYAAYSALSIMYQSWGAMLGGDEGQRSRIVAWREGLGLVGVIVASITPAALGIPATTALFFIALAAGLLAWRLAPRPGLNTHVQPSSPGGTGGLWLPFAKPGFRALLGVFVVNGIASAVPATLILFFVQDRLQAPPGTEPLFLGSYFLSAALAIPLWLRVVNRLGLARTWGLGMLLSIATFIFASQLGSGDVTALSWCVRSRVWRWAPTWPCPAHCWPERSTPTATAGAQRALILAGGISPPSSTWRWRRASPCRCWALWATPPGARDAAALQTLTWAYCLLPCALKLLAAGLLYTLIIRKTP